MDLIETLNPAAFTDYLKRFNNTICGRHPIGVMLQVIKINHLKCSISYFDVSHFALIVGCSNITNTWISNELQISEVCTK